MATRDRKIERAREALREKEQKDQVEAEREEPEGHDRPRDEPDPRTKRAGSRPGQRQQ